MSSERFGFKAALYGRADFDSIHGAFRFGLNDVIFVNTLPVDRYEQVGAEPVKGFHWITFSILRKTSTLPTSWLFRTIPGTP
jgi:hypothetical protein